MFVPYNHYFLDQNREIVPSWANSERYAYCDYFSNIVSFFKNR